ncbi:MAG: hypothetical protein QOD06_86 [Candidatus Binatota bacterium]|nr:hypothetical protein [Candidatus Binatota bacterium]
MTAFADADELYRYMGAIFEEAFADAEVRKRFADSGVVLKLKFTDPPAALVIDMVNGTVTRGDDGAKPTVEMTTTGDVGHRFWLGKVDIALALLKGEIRAKGPIAKIIKLVPVARQVFPRYRELLERAGRQDLLDA